MIYTTLNKIRAHHPREHGWKKLLTSLGKTKADDAPVSLAYILESNGLDDALWCLRTLPELDNHWRMLAVKFARTVGHLMTDKRSTNALDVAERHAVGDATDDELDAAGAVSRAAAEAARDAAWAAAEAARDAARAAARAARDAAGAANKKIFVEFLETIDNA